MCFEDCHSSYLDMPDVAQKVRRGAALCRDQLTESTKMLRQVLYELYWVVNYNFFSLNIIFFIAFF